MFSGANKVPVTRTTDRHDQAPESRGCFEQFGLLDLRPMVMAGGACITPSRVATKYELAASRKESLA